MYPAQIKKQNQTVIIWNSVRLDYMEEELDYELHYEG